MKTLRARIRARRDVFILETVVVCTAEAGETAGRKKEVKGCAARMWRIGRRG